MLIALRRGRAPDAAMALRKHAALQQQRELQTRGRALRCAGSALLGVAASSCAIGMVRNAVKFAE